MDWVACVGVDWGDREHAFVEEAVGRERRKGTFSASSEGVHEWVVGLRERHPSGTVAVIVEQGRGSLIYALMAYEFVAIVPVNPRVSKSYRVARRPSGASNDRLDAELLCEYGVKHQDELRVWQPDDVLTRRLRFLVEGRRRFVDQKTALTHELGATLKLYFPQALQWFGPETAALLRAFLSRWPTLGALERATLEEIQQVMRSVKARKIPTRSEAIFESIASAIPMTKDPAVIETSALRVQSLLSMIEPLLETIAMYDKTIAQVWNTHPDYAIFSTLPGAGAVLAPRLAVAFGMDRSRYADARELQCYSGIAPVEESSGKQRWIHARWGFPKFLHQSFHEFAQASLPKSRWARAVYHALRERGAGHHAAIRALAFRWMRVLFALWTNGTTYDQAAHIQHLKQRGAPIVSRLAA